MMTSTVPTKDGRQSEPKLRKLWDNRRVTCESMDLQPVQVSKGPVSRRCVVPGCGAVQMRSPNYDDPNHVPFVTFPHTSGARAAWFKSLGCIPTTKQRLYVCLRHFKEEHIKKTGADGRPLKAYNVTKEAIPTENLNKGRRPVYKFPVDSPEVTLKKLRSSINDAIPGLGDSSLIFFNAPTGSSSTTSNGSPANTVTPLPSVAVATSQMLLLPLTRKLLDEFAEYAVLPAGWTLMKRFGTKFHCFAKFSVTIPTVLKAVGFSDSLTPEIFVENLEYIGSKCGNSAMKCLGDVQKLVEQVESMNICRGVILSGEDLEKMGVVRLPDCELLVPGGPKTVRCDRCTSQQEVITKNLKNKKRRKKRPEIVPAKAILPAEPEETMVISAAAITRLVECGLIKTGAGLPAVSAVPDQPAESANIDESVTSAEDGNQEVVAEKSGELAQGSDEMVEQLRGRVEDAAV